MGLRLQDYTVKHSMMLLGSGFIFTIYRDSKIRRSKSVGYNARNTEITVSKGVIHVCAWRKRNAVCSDLG